MHLPRAGPEAPRSLGWKWAEARPFHPSGQQRVNPSGRRRTWERARDRELFSQVIFPQVFAFHSYLLKVCRN